MPIQDNAIPIQSGLYETVVTGLHSQRLSDDNAVMSALDPGDAHVYLSRAIYDYLSQALQGVSGGVEAQVEICNKLIDLIGTEVPSREIGSNQHLRPQMLMEVLSPHLIAAGPTVSSIRPTTPLSQSNLLVNGARDLRIGAEVAQEIPSADSVDLLCSFILWTGFVQLRSILQQHCNQGKRLRIITTTYMGVTDLRALTKLQELGAEIRISYDRRHTRLHAKAWLFNRNSGYSTAFVGSSNLSRAALVDGIEWNVRLSEVESPPVIDKFKGTFETYWSDAEFAPFDAERFQSAIKSEQSLGAGDLTPLEVRPYPFQQEILDRLWVERDLHDRWKNLVVAATGTGKTVIAAMDYASCVKRFGPLRVLFVAHRVEILKQSRSTFRHVLRNGSFGELWVSGQRPQSFEHVFAAVQSLNQADLTSILPDAFDVIIIDEVHHAAAATYQTLLTHFRPRILLGLTATPERTDGISILDWFGGRIAAELRLWDAISRGLLTPFLYFALSDDTDLTTVAWRSGRYDVRELENLYTGDHARARIIGQAVHDYIRVPKAMRALGFCVSVRHAEFMAERFSEFGYQAIALSGDTPAEQRSQAIADLAAGRLQVLFSVDLFNEGVDIPSIDTILLLRPTESVLLFLQQLGRGLRRSNG
ncbi:MAG: DEAD/DEAH box helicase family protein, partial [Candidatus Sericytochromatia bacterium]|nr:DEAD/DEAH box helicase family protein [Candidatus Sericytochromatia bacterium]